MKCKNKTSIRQHFSKMMVPRNLGYFKTHSSLSFPLQEDSQIFIYSLVVVLLVNIVNNLKELLFCGSATIVIKFTPTKLNTENSGII